MNITVLCLELSQSTLQVSTGRGQQVNRTPGYKWGDWRKALDKNSGWGKC